MKTRTRLIGVAVFLAERRLIPMARDGDPAVCETGRNSLRGVCGMLR